MRAAWWVPGLVLLALSACGGPRFREGTVDAGDPCYLPTDCPVNFTCDGCSVETLTCLDGCHTDEDCAYGTCSMNECVTCPCVGVCAR